MDILICENHGVIKETQNYHSVEDWLQGNGQIYIFRSNYAQLFSTQTQLANHNQVLGIRYAMH